MVVRTAGITQTGQITVWGRRATRVVAPWVTTGLLPGVARVWCLRCLPQRLPAGLVVSSSGLAWWTYLPHGVNRGQYVTTSLVPVPSTPGLTTLLRWVPVGTLVGQVGWFARAPGTVVKILRHRGGRTECRLPSRKTRWLSTGLVCVVGAGGHPQWSRTVVPTAGAAHRQGARPVVRGVAMNPVDHPHGGGQGKTAGGRPGTTPWGRLTKGYKTVR